jgi:CheY-like chemotaxis protein
MDIQMPVMDGLTTTRAIRNELKLKESSVNALSAGVLAEEKPQALDVGVHDFLPEPMNFGQMAEMISHFCVIKQ